MKSVILFNPEDMTYAVVGMNYTDEEASKEVENLKEEGAFHVDQCGKRYESESELEARMDEVTKGNVTRAPL